MALSKEWTDRKTTDKEKADFEKYILNSGQLLDRLSDMINKRIDEINRAEDKDDFSSPAWAMQQASRQGRRRAFNEILKLLDRGAING